MTFKQRILSLLLYAFTQFFAPAIFADDSLGQVIQINTRFHSVAGNPTWLLLIRDEDNGKVMPYIFHVNDTDNAWIAFTYGHNYRINASKVVFGPRAVINNFCHLQSGIISNKSMIVTLTGDLTPARQTSTCHINVFQDAGEYPIAQ